MIVEHLWEDQAQLRPNSQNLIELQTQWHTDGSRCVKEIVRMNILVATKKMKYYPVGLLQQGKLEYLQIKNVSLLIQHIIRAVIIISTKHFNSRLESNDSHKQLQHCSTQVESQIALYADHVPFDQRDSRLTTNQSWGVRKFILRVRSNFAP